MKQPYVRHKQIRLFLVTSLVLVFLLSAVLVRPPALQASNAAGEGKPVRGLDVLLPTIESARSGNWNDPATWRSGRVPGTDDVVLIQAGATVTAPSIKARTLVNKGTLQGSGDGPLVIDVATLRNTGVIRTGTGKPASVTPNAISPNHVVCNGAFGIPGANIVLPAAMIYNNGVIVAGNGVNGGRGGSIIWAPAPNTWLWNDVAGQLRAGNGGNGAPGMGGGPGGNVRLTGSPFDNFGLIRAGNGGNGDQCGGDGGVVFAFGQNTTNTGSIIAGNGGNTVANFATAHGGNGGRAEVWGKFFGPGGFLVNQVLGLIQGGRGGNGNPAAFVPQAAGCGGDVILMANPNVFLFGRQLAGAAGIPSAGGAACWPGRVIIEPSEIELSGSSAKVEGKDLSVYGGDDWILDLRNLGSVRLTATGDITLAVGLNGVVDLTGNATRVLQAAGMVRIYANDIRLDPGVSLQTVAGSNVIASPSRILRGASVAGPETAGVLPGTMVPVTFEVFNIGPVSDNLDLSVTDTAGWNLSGWPSQITLDGLGHQSVTVNVFVPANAAPGSSDEITLVAVSHTDPTARASGQATLVVTSQTAGQPPAEAKFAHDRSWR